MPAAFVDALLADSAAEEVVGILSLLCFAVWQFAQGQVAQGVVMVFCAVEFGDPVADGAV